jgi:hypothetical protein
MVGEILIRRYFGGVRTLHFFLNPAHAAGSIAGRGRGAGSAAANKSDCREEPLLVCAKDAQIDSGFFVASYCNGTGIRAFTEVKTAGSS